jgi:hypothetical protein
MKKENYIKVYCCTDSLINFETYYYIFSTTFNLKELEKKVDDIIDALRDKYNELFYDIEFKVTKKDVKQFLKASNYNCNIENIDEMLIKC